MCVGGRAHLCVCVHAFIEGKNKAFKKEKQIETKQNNVDMTVFQDSCSEWLYQKECSLAKYAIVVNIHQDFYSILF